MVGYRCVCDLFIEIFSIEVVYNSFSLNFFYCAFFLRGIKTIVMPAYSFIIPRGPLNHACFLVRTSL
jgi:hypothetical protein